jgi:hypothetical protein
VLRFKKVNQVRPFTVTIRSVDGRRVNAGIAEGQLKWISGKNVVRSPILVSWQKFVKDINSTASAHLNH